MVTVLARSFRGGPFLLRQASAQLTDNQQLSLGNKSKKLRNIYPKAVRSINVAKHLCPASGQ
jgi:hypothetical protein